MTLSKLLTTVVCVLRLGAVTPTLTSADQAQYITTTWDSRDVPTK